jgi:hypothetical protein
VIDYVENKYRADCVDASLPGMRRLVLISKSSGAMENQISLYIKEVLLQSGMN